MSTNVLLLPREPLETTSNKVLAKTSEATLILEATFDASRIDSVSDSCPVGPCRVHPMGEAIQQITGLTGLKSPRNPPPRGSSTAEHLDSWCFANGIRRRAIDLDEEWWQRDSGPLLAFRGLEPVSLLPRAFGAYTCIAGDGTRSRVDAELASDIGRQAHALYPPLASKRIRLPDLLRLGLRGLYTDSVFILILSLSSGLLALATPLATEYLIDSLIRQSQPSKLVMLTAGLVASAIAIALMQLARGYAMMRLEDRLDQSLQSSLWNRLLSLPTSFFRRFSVGDLSARSMGIRRIHELITGDLSSAVLALLATLASLGILFAYNGVLASIAVSLVALQGSVALWVALRQLKYERQRQELGGRLSGLLHNLLAGLPKLRAGRVEKRAFLRWAERFAETRRVEVGSRRLADFQGIFGEVFASVTVLVLFVGMTVALQSGMTVGELLAVHAAFGQFQMAALAVLGVVPTLIGFIPTWERLQPILEALPESHVELEDSGPISGQAELREVSFRYRELGPLVLDRVSIRLQAGEMVALVGPSGSGKSTCMRLLLGFEQPEQGQVFFDGRALSSLEPNSLRRQFGAVLQHGRPSVGTIFHNIVGTEPANMDDAWWAAERAGIADEIRAMPMGMFTMVNERAASFSGGQRQRLLLARAILRRPRLFLLDEATSALDNATQQRVVDYLDEVGATRLVIAHRLSTVRNADRIYVLDEGRVVEHGTFGELLKNGGLFARMAARQTL